MPSYGEIFAFPSIFNERLSVVKYQPVGADAFELWVDSVNGSDVGGGRGPQAAPFLTVPAALQYAWTLQRQETLLIHLVPQATAYAIPAGYVFPAIVSPDGPDASSQAFGFGGLSPLVIRADPTLLLSIPLANILAQNLDPVSGLLSLVTDLALVPGAFAGRFLVDDAGNLAAIRTNDATTLEVAFANTLTAPISVYNRGATIAGDAASLQPTLNLKGGTAPIVVQGVNLTATLGGAVGVAQVGPVRLEACSVPWAVVGQQPNTPAEAPGFIELVGCVVGDLSLGAGALSLSRCVVNDGDVVAALPGCRVTAQETTFASANNSLFVDNDGHTVGSFELQNVDILTPAAEAVFVFGNTAVLIAVKITGAAARGVSVGFGGKAQLLGVGGSGNAVGLVVREGGLVAVDNTTAIAGNAGADIQVEGLPAVTWANFRAGSPPLALKAPGGSAVIQGADTAVIQSPASISAASPVTLTKAFSYVLLDNSAAALARSLMPLAGCRGQVLYLKALSGAFAVTVTPAGGETIEGAANLVLNAANQAVLLVAPDTGTDWKVFALYGGGAVAGGISLSAVSKVFADSGYTSTPTDQAILWDTSGGPCIQNLPDINTVRRQVLYISKTNMGNPLTIDPNGAQTINNAGTLALVVRSTAQLYAPPTGTNWIIL